MVLFLVHSSLTLSLIDALPDEIVSQGEVSLQIYLSSCSEGTASTVFLRVDVVGRDGAGKTSLTKSLTLQGFDPDELSTRGVVFDPKCQIIIKEACDWTTRLTSEHLRDMHNKNVIAIMAGKLDTPEVKDWYFRSKEAEREQSKRKKPIREYTNVLERSVNTRNIASKTDSPLVDPEDFSVDVKVTNSTEQNLTLSPEDTSNVHQDDESNPAAEVCDSRFYENEFEPQMTMPDYHRVTSSLLVSPVSSETPEITSNDFPILPSTLSPSNSLSAPKPQRSLDAHQFAVSGSVTSIDIMEEEAVGSITNFSSGVKGTSTGESSTVILPHESKYAKRNTKDKTKTKIQATIPLAVKKGVSKFLRDKESFEMAQKEMMVTVLDYAGQHVFYATHHLCLSKAGFYYVVFDASQPLDGRTPSLFRVKEGKIVHVPLFDDETNFDRLLEWMSAIHIMEPDHSHRIMVFDEVGIASPAMFLVGTHADKAREQPGMLETQDELMRKKLEDTVLAEHIIWASKNRMCFYVDNTLTNPQRGRVDPQVCILRQMTEEVACKVAQHHKLPLTWLKFEQEVRDMKILDKTKKIVSVKDLFHIAKKAAGIKTKEELKVLLHYLSNRAVVLYRPKALKCVEEEVVLDVEWLISQLEKIVTIHTDVPPKFKNDITRAVQRGIMTASLIRYLLSENSSAQQLIISLMNHFDLLCQYSGFESYKLQNADDNQDFLCLNGPEEDMFVDEIATTGNCDYFIPCLLERSSPLESQQMDVTLKTMPLLLSSAPLRIPRPLFYRVLTHLCKRFRRLPVLYSNVGYFHISPDHRLEFSLNRYSFQFAILSETQMPLRSIVCSCARDYIVNVVDKLKLEGMAGLKLQIGFHLTGMCFPMSGVPEDNDLVSLDGFPDQRRHLYSSKTNRQVECPPELLMWYPQLEQNVGTIYLMCQFCV